MFTPSRLTLARQRCRLSKKELAEAVGLTPHSILRYENGESAPTDEIISRLAKCLGFAEGFFHGPDIDPPPEDIASFRSMRAMSAKERDAALAAGAIAYIVSDWVELNFDLPQPDILDLAGDTPEIAAVSLREKWGLGEQPIKNMAHLLEAKGVRLFSMAENTLTVDAFSVWRGGTPYVFLNTMKSAEHGRHDAAHELGHLT
ncbi:MAG: XRE family transcriptional regulator, partial [Stellaceae bacterium]